MIFYRCDEIYHFFNTNDLINFTLIMFGFFEHSSLWLELTIVMKLFKKVSYCEEDSKCSKIYKKSLV